MLFDTNNCFFLKNSPFSNIRLPQYMLCFHTYYIYVIQYSAQYENLYGGILPEEAASILLTVGRYTQ